MTGGIPKEGTYERVMSLINNEELNKILFDFFNAIIFSKSVDTEMYNIDGRVNNGSKQNLTINNTAKKPLNCLNVYSNKYKYCLYTKQIEEKTNEIPMVEELINGLNLKGIIVTWDALNTQIKNIRVVINAGGDYKNTIKNAKKNMIEKDMTSIENRYYISNKQVNIEEFDTATKGHWNIENKIH